MIKPAQSGENPECFRIAEDRRRIEKKEYAEGCRSVTVVRE
jgi:hypothetical protein